MFESLFTRVNGNAFPRFLYDLSGDMFALVRHWNPELSGAGRGREFENLFYRYCDFRHLALSERAGSRTFRGFRSNSGLQHESDGIIAGPDASVHLELKYLLTELQKNDLLIFNQKGIDFLLGLPVGMREKPLYRILLSGGDISEEARVFALQWGIALIEPNALPLLTIHQLVGSHVPMLSGVPISLQDEIWRGVPRLIVPLKQKLHSVSEALSGRMPLADEDSCRRLLRSVQLGIGERYWAALDETAPTWIEEHYVELATHLFVRVRKKEFADVADVAG